jgi:hypothetical protein
MSDDWMGAPVAAGIPRLIPRVDAVEPVVRAPRNDEESSDGQHGCSIAGGSTSEAPTGEPVRGGGEASRRGYRYMIRNQTRRKKARAHPS